MSSLTAHHYCATRKPCFVKDDSSTHTSHTAETVIMSNQGSNPYTNHEAARLIQSLVDAFGPENWIVALSTAGVLLFGSVSEAVSSLHLDATTADRIRDTAGDLSSYVQVHRGHHLRQIQAVLSSFYQEQAAIPLAVHGGSSPQLSSVSGPRSVDDGARGNVPAALAAGVNPDAGYYAAATVDTLSLGSSIMEGLTVDSVSPNTAFESALPAEAAHEAEDPNVEADENQPGDSEAKGPNKRPNEEDADPDLDKKPRAN